MSASKRDSDFTARVAAALRIEDHSPQVRQRHWARYLGGGAIAAGVAVAALMLNPPNPRTGTSASVAQVRPQPTSVAPTLLAVNPPTPAWLLPRQPTVLSAQPASANIVYGTGLMQPDYLRRAIYARDEVMPFAPSFQPGQPALPFSIVLLPEPPPSSAAAARH